MVKHKCSACGFRAKYDNNPKSVLGKVWKWHAVWCPGWKKYINFLPDDERKMLADRYDMDKYK